MTAYLNMVIRFAPARDDYVATITVPERDTANSEFRLPPGLADLLQRHTSVARAVRLDSRSARDFDQEPELLPANIGQRLYSALFIGEAANSLSSNLAYSSAERRPLRIAFHFNLKDAKQAALARVPWELLRSPTSGKWLAFSGDATIVRSVDVTDAPDPSPYEAPLRILFVMANPRADLDLRYERTKIEKALRQARVRIAKLEYLEDASFSDLEEKLDATDPHVIHFMGHGGMHGGQGILQFQDGPVSGTRLGDLVVREKATRLVVLNACRTAEFEAVGDADPFKGVAASIFRSGVPAVVAMQFPISDDAAIRFSARFYERIAQGESVESAVDSGRSAIVGSTAGPIELAAGTTQNASQGVNASGESNEWATPVLFIRGDGDLFRTQPHRLWEVPRRLLPTRAWVASIPAAGLLASSWILVDQDEPRMFWWLLGITGMGLLWWANAYMARSSLQPRNVVFGWLSFVLVLALSTLVAGGVFMDPFLVPSQITICGVVQQADGTLIDGATVELDTTPLVEQTSAERAPCSLDADDPHTGTFAFLLRRGAVRFNHPIDLVVSHPAFDSIKVPIDLHKASVDSVVITLTKDGS